LHEPAGRSSRGSRGPPGDARRSTP
jgi:hypothetical protein